VVRIPTSIALLCLAACDSGTVGNPPPTPVGDPDAAQGDDDTGPDNDTRATVTIAITGEGTLEASAGVLECAGTTCTLLLDVGQSADLTAVAAFRSRFLTWSGDCAGADATIEVSTTGSCTAQFVPVPRGLLAAEVSVSREVIRVPAPDAPASDSETMLLAETDAGAERRWRVLDSATRAVVFESYLEAPIFTCAYRGAFDVTLEVSDGAQFSEVRHRRLITCTLPRTAAGRTVHTLTLSGSAYSQLGRINGTVVNPGDVIRIAHPAGQSTYGNLIGFLNFRGTAEAPIHIINDGPVTLDIPAGGSTKSFYFVNCAHIILDGFGDDATPYGFVVESHAAGETAVWFRNINEGGNVRTGMTGVEIFGVWIRQNALDGTFSGGTGIQVETAGSPEYNRNNWRFDGLRVHHTRVENVGNEGMYLGYTRDFLSSTGGETALPYQLYDTHVYRNILRSTGNDGIQTCNNVEGMEIHDNDVEDTGRNGQGFHLSSYQHNPGNAGWVFNNRLVSANGGLNLQVGCTGGDLYFFNNRVHTAIAGAAMYLASGDTNAVRFYIFGNTFSVPNGEGIAVNLVADGCNSDGTLGPDVTRPYDHYLQANNVFVVPSAAEVFRRDSPGTVPGTWVTAPNLRRDPSAVADLCGVDAASGDLEPTCGTSVALEPTGVSLVEAIAPEDLPLGGFTDATGRVFDDPRGQGAYQAVEP
jgi:hypothetical protein